MEIGYGIHDYSDDIRELEKKVGVLSSENKELKENKGVKK